MVFPLQTQTAAEQQLHENNVSVRSDCVKTEDPEDTNKKVHYLNVSTCVLMIKSWRAFPQVSRKSVCFPHNTNRERASPPGYNISSLVLVWNCKQEHKLPGTFNVGDLGI